MKETLRKWWYLFIKDLLLGSLIVILLIAIIGVLFAFAQALLPDDLWVWALIGIVGFSLYVTYKIDRRMGD